MFRRFFGRINNNNRVLTIKQLQYLYTPNSISSILPMVRGQTLIFFYLVLSSLISPGSKFLCLHNDYYCLWQFSKILIKYTPQFPVCLELNDNFLFSPSLLHTEIFLLKTNLYLIDYSSSIVWECYEGTERNTFNSSDI